MTKFFKNKVLLYTLSRYFTYAVQFIGSLFIAQYLGVYYLGVWGFILLIIQYSVKINFGIANATNAIISTHKSENEYIQQIVGVAISMLFVLCFFTTLFFSFFYVFDVSFGEKYYFIQYMPYVLLIVIFTHFNLFFSNIFRVYGKLGSIAFSQSIIPFALLAVTFLYAGEQLVFALLLTYLASVFVSLVIFMLSSPISLKPIFDKKIFKIIQIKGWYLFIYNASFYLIILSTRGFVSKYYSVEEFGYFTFAFTLASAILLLFDSISFLVFPKVLNRFAHNSDQQAVILLNALRKSYITICHFTMHVGILCYPILMLLFPQYKNTHTIFIMIGLAVLIHTNSFGYQGLIIAKGKEKNIALISFVALLATLLLNSIIMKINIPLEFVMLPTLCVYLVYVCSLAQLGRRVINQDVKFSVIFYDALNLRWMIPILVSILITLLEFNVVYYYLLPLIMFVFLNYNNLKQVLIAIKKIVNDPKVIDI